MSNQLKELQIIEENTNDLNVNDLNINDLNINDLNPNPNSNPNSNPNEHNVNEKNTNSIKNVRQLSHKQKKLQKTLENKSYQRNQKVSTNELKIEPIPIAKCVTKKPQKSIKSTTSSKKYDEKVLDDNLFSAFGRNPQKKRGDPVT